MRAARDDRTLLQSATGRIPLWVLCWKSRQQLNKALLHQDILKTPVIEISERGNFLLLPLLIDSLNVSMRQRADCQTPPQEEIYSIHRHMVLFTQHHLSLLVLKKHICSVQHCDDELEQHAQQPKDGSVWRTKLPTTLEKEFIFLQFHFTE